MERSASRVAVEGSWTWAASGRERAASRLTRCSVLPRHRSRTASGAVMSRSLNWLNAAVRALTAPVRAMRSRHRHLRNSPIAPTCSALVAAFVSHPHPDAHGTGSTVREALALALLGQTLPESDPDVSCGP